ncbi:iron chaperone [Leifsonia sp. NPDC058248]|uniref:iron chaperone n=1 Tax=Leifsonia sp. NPDC058248 TaxID=3346402 RepID=UPI0036DBEFB1
MASTPGTVDEYIAAADPAVRETLTRLRETIHAAVPDSAEKIRYGIPAIAIGGTRWLHFAAWKHHVGLYPVSRLDPALEERMRPYRTTTSTVKFPLAAPIPFDLVAEVARALHRAAV